MKDKKSMNENVPWKNNNLRHNEEKIRRERERWKKNLRAGGEGVGRANAVVDVFGVVNGGQTADELVERLPVNDQTADPLRIVRNDVGCPDVLSFYSFGRGIKIQIIYSLNV